MATCGYGGYITGVGSNIEVTNWSIDDSVDIYETTSMAISGNGWKSRIACLAGAPGSFETVGAMVVPASYTSCAFHAGPVTISGDIIVDKVSVSTDVADIVKYSHSFKFSGSYTAAYS
jgi:hypothetical protein